MLYSFLENWSLCIQLNIENGHPTDVYFGYRPIGYILFAHYLQVGLERIVILSQSLTKLGLKLFQKQFVVYL